VILVDTSVWIDYLNGQMTPAVVRLQTLLNRQQTVAITEMILMEILQGTKDSKTYDRYRQYFIGQAILQPIHGIESYAEAALLYRQCRAKGITIRSTIDCLIAQIAIEHEVALLHSDQDFDHLAIAVPTLKIDNI
jgi:predicted nucleic acid-binding protein